MLSWCTELRCSRQQYSNIASQGRNQRYQANAFIVYGHLPSLRVRCRFAKSTIDRSKPRSSKESTPFPGPVWSNIIPSDRFEQSWPPLIMERSRWPLFRKFLALVTRIASLSLHQSHGSIPSSPAIPIRSDWSDGRPSPDRRKCSRSR